MNFSPFFESNLNLTRRHFFGKSALGVGTAAMAGLLNQGLLGKTGGAGGLTTKLILNR